VIPSRAAGTRRRTASSSRLTGLLLFAALVLAPAAHADLSGSSELEQRFALTTLKRFPPTTRAFRPTGRDSFQRLGTFRLGAGSRQGPRSWYVGHLHFQLTLARLQGGGRVYISADTNERTFAQVEFERVGRGIRWSTYDLFGGESEGLFTDRDVEISFYNYLQDKGVLPGTNSIQLHVEQFGAARVERVITYSDSAIQKTSRSPYPLALTIRPLDGRVTVGDQFRIKFTLATRNDGDRLEQVALEPTYDKSRLRIVPPIPKTSFETLRGSADGILVFEPLQAGGHKLGFLANSNINNPGTTLLVQVDPRRERWYEDTQGQVGAAIVVIGLVLTTGGIVWRRRTSSR
jgi:hypothetical protein